MNNIDTNISENLTPFESKVLNLIDSIRQKRTPSTVVRVVGGWVRDKMLNQPSDDIDLMVDNMSGEQFANIMAEELRQKGPAVVKANPEKTKNIETATMTIPVDGQEVELDFAQCRSEDYSGGTSRREVDVKPATAEEDAMRRDLTIGALFYNINEKKVEDFTGKGLKDLITGTIRTPYDNGGVASPEVVNDVKKSFIDDPLRVFRAIRFASKYEGDFSPATKAALSDPEVIDGIFYSDRKISSDRIGKELKRMFEGPHPEIAVKILKEAGLMQILLNEAVKGSKYEGEMEELDMEQNNPHHELTVWGHTYQVLVNFLQNFPQDDPDKKVIMVLAALTHDLGKLYKQIHAESMSHPGRTSYHGHEKESAEICKLLMKFLRIENSMIKQVSGLARYHMQPHNLGRQEGSMSAIRRFIRRMGENSLNWLDVFNLSVADAYSKNEEVSEEVVQKYDSFRQKLEEALASMNVQENSTTVKPVLNGNDIMNIMGIKPGAHMSTITNYIKSLMDEYPDITAEDATNRLQEIKSRAEQLMTQDPNLEYEKAIEVVIGQTTASSNSRMVAASYACPQHLFKKTYNDVQSLINQGKLQEAMANLNKLVEDYGDDIRVARLAAITQFNVLKKESKLRDNDLLQYILNKTQHNLFDPVLTSYSTGLLIMVKTITEPKEIEKIGSEVAELNPGILRGVLDSLPQKVHHEEIKNKLKAQINEDL